jgi:hypothetical protein
MITRRLGCSAQLVIWCCVPSSKLLCSKKTKEVWNCWIRAATHTRVGKVVLVKWIVPRVIAIICIYSDAKKGNVWSSTKQLSLPPWGRPRVISAHNSQGLLFLRFSNTSRKGAQPKHGRVKSHYSWRVIRVALFAFLIAGAKTACDSVWVNSTVPLRYFRIIAIEQRWYMRGGIGQYVLYRASVLVHGCTLPFLPSIPT